MKIDCKPKDSPVIQTSGQAGVIAMTGLTDKLSIPVTLDGFSAIFAKSQ